MSAGEAAPLISPLQIGPVTIDPPVVLAPMAGYTDASLRSICHGFGAALTYTEVANAAGLVHGSKPTWHLLDIVPDESPIAAHIYGADASLMADAAARIEQLGRFDLIDINCGCPVRKIVAKGAGAALMRDPQRIHDIVAAVCAAVSIPVTVKTRIGLRPDTVNIMETSAAAETGGASAIAIHGRLASNHHKGESDWELIARVKAARDIPVIGNGGVDCAADAPRMFADTGVDGVMIARAAVGAPWIFQDIRHLLRGEDPHRHTLAELRSVAAEQLRRLVVLKEREQQIRRRSSLTPDEAAALHFRAHLFQYFRGLENWSDVRRNLNDIRSSEDVMRAVDMVVARQRGEFVPAKSAPCAAP